MLPAVERRFHCVTSTGDCHVSLLLLAPAQPRHHCCCLQVSYSQHGWWETRDCTQGMCTLAPDPDGTNSSILHPGERGYRGAGAHTLGANYSAAASCHD